MYCVQGDTTPVMLESVKEEPGGWTVTFAATTYGQMLEYRGRLYNEGDAPSRAMPVPTPPTVNRYTFTVEGLDLETALRERLPDGVRLVIVNGVWTLEVGS